MALVGVMALLVAWPQVWAALRYYPTTIRMRIGYQEKVARGSVPWWELLRRAVVPNTRHRVGGLHPPEVAPSCGLPALLIALVPPWGFWHLVWVVTFFLAQGSYTPFFRWTHWLHFRIPARYTYLMGLTMALAAVEALTGLPPSMQRLVLLLQVWYLLTVHAKLLPMEPWVQRWERPGHVFASPLAAFLAGNPGRVSGLPYPIRTGHLTHTWTLGYNGSAQPQWMAWLRGDTNPDGSGAHDWFALRPDGPALDEYGVRYVYSYRRLLAPRWRETVIPHLYENTMIQADRILPSWHWSAHTYVCGSARHLG